MELWSYAKGEIFKAASAKYILLAIAFVVFIVNYFLKTAMIMVLGPTKNVSFFCF